MIYKTLTKQEFIDEFGNSGDYANNFSYDGLSVLYEYFDDIGYSNELDVIGICCDFEEYENFKEMVSAYPDDYKTLEDFENATVVLPTESGSFVIQEF
jgi:hypothetical protein|tara:strand:+ start:621 stop:914 length:294 start_codon:yes stop_codon:yes gene_type:complete